MNITNSQLDLIVSGFLIWETIWKGLALWKSSKNDHRYWFISILLLNTIGILPITYLLINKYYFNKKSESTVVASTKIAKSSKKSK